MARAAMSHANIPREICPKIAVEILSTVTLLDGLSVVDYHGTLTTQDIIIYGENPRWAAVVKEGKDGKTGDRGITVMFVGYTLDRTQDTYRFYNKTTNCIIVSRDAIWLNKMYFTPQHHRVLYWMMMLMTLLWILATN
jgi:hypothetical protein